jgi:glc operon protein GlcG
MPQLNLRRFARNALVAAAVLGMSAVRAADTAAAPTLTLEGAERIVAAAVAYARSHDAPGAAIAVVDAGGHPILVERLDGTFPAGADISVGKARTAVMFRRPTRGLEEAINKGRDAMIPVAAVTWFTPLQGGVPVVVDGRVVGGVGVSGAASAQQDEELALAGAQALAAGAPRAAVKHIAADEVAQAFAVGATGDTLVASADFRVNASRREGPGEAEVHLTDTDIFYVIEGRATVVVGGEIVDPRSAAPSEVRGPAIRGGEEKVVSRGDVLVVPAGAPHWFKSVKTPFRYYVVKSVTGS